MSPEPATLRCPSCGALVDPESRSCRYCSAVLALVACPSCFAPMFQGAKHCSRCGAEASRQRVGSAARDCPECRRRLGAVSVGPVTLDECSGCGGVFVDKPAFERICSEREQQAMVLKSSLAESRRPAAPPRTDRYWPCPDCGQLMNRQNFARISGVVLDVCRNHGVWFNYGELTRLVEFIRGGGLSRARDREIQDVREERERLQHAQRIDAIRTARLPNQGSGEGLELGSLFSLFDDIFLE